MSFDNTSRRHAIGLVDNITSFYHNRSRRILLSLIPRTLCDRYNFRMMQDVFQKLGAGILENYIIMDNKFHIRWFHKYYEPRFLSFLVVYCVTRKIYANIAC